MNRRRRLVPLLLAASASVLIQGCASPRGNESAQLEHQDSPVAIEIKAMLLEKQSLSGSAIDVSAEDGDVVLTGFVETQDQKREAEAVASQHDQAGRVRNKIEVKK